MKLFLKRHAPLFYSLCAMLVLYIPWLNRGYVNLEYPFSMAARGLIKSDQVELMQAYWSNQANPLGYSLILSLLYRIFGIHDWFWLAKMPSFAGAFLIVFSGWLFLQTEKSNPRNHFYLWFAVLVFSPMVMAYSTSATADMLPAGIFLISLAIVFREPGGDWRLNLFASFLFSISVLIKYNTAYLGLMLVVCAFLSASKNYQDKKIFIRIFLIFVMFPLVVMLIYTYWIYYSFRIFISTGLAGGAPNFLDLSLWAMTFLKYLSFLGLFCGLTSVSVFKFKKQNLLKWLVGTSLAITTGWVVSGYEIDGELNFGGGFLFGEIFRRLLQTFGFVSGVALCKTCYCQFKRGDNISRILISGLLPYLILISASRPTQRYLIFAIPIVLLILVKESEFLSLKFRTVIFSLTIIGFASVSLFGMSYLRAQGNASENMAVWVEDNELISQTSAGAISPHAGQHFWGVEMTQLKYDVIAVTPNGESQIKEKILHREPMNVLGKVTRIYVLREIPASP